MAMFQDRAWCGRCGGYRLHGRRGVEHGWGCLLTLVTGGLFVPVWAMMVIANGFEPWRCQACGASYAWRADPYYVAKAKRSPARRLAAGLSHAAAAGWSGVRSSPAAMLAAYRALPEWAAPIVWGLGVAAPIVSAVVAWHVLGR